ncbi:hypothetical protein Q8A67_013492 [Cirrhinus molitorella]|uniref:Uncharacterized protein n=1 Tax=Cirrhinus molitorella TaxID=172907 RepID=A0AA88PIF3_9TELE|nr:hypothetical protein Q8A67_013492 [Cirrhinus molitorella]
MGKVLMSACIFTVVCRREGTPHRHPLPTEPRAEVFVCARGRGCAETRRVYKPLQQTSDMEEMEKMVALEKLL